jgi:23S rRNA pseudouridine1911/1915/1917 synthase
MGRHPTQRTKMAVVDEGKLAITHYRLEKRLPFHTLLKVNLETGRTHQIRVHMAHIGHPIVGDPLYARLLLPKGATESVREILKHFKRQALHAHRLRFEHPITKKMCEFSAPLPEDMINLLDVVS